MLIEIEFITSHLYFLPLSLPATFPWPFIIIVTYMHMQIYKYRLLSLFLLFVHIWFQC